MIDLTDDLYKCGNTELLELPKIAFLASRDYTENNRKKAIKWACKMVKEDKCIISGFQSELEEIVFEILLSGDQPIIMVLAHCLETGYPESLSPYIESGRLLLLSQFNDLAPIDTHENGLLRNKLVIDLADSVVIGSMSKEGKTKTLISSTHKPILLLDDRYV